MSWRSCRVKACGAIALDELLGRGITRIVTDYLRSREPG
jgi:hypothetical protein